MAFIQAASASGTTSANPSLSGVAAGSTILVFAWDGTTSNDPGTTVSDSQGSYTAQGSAVQDAGDSIFARMYALQNANAGTHSITVTMGSGNAVFAVAVELSAPTSGAVSGTNGAVQTSPGTGTDAVSSGTVTVSGSATLVAMSSDTTDVSASDEPAVGTGGFTSQLAGSNGTMGSWRVETKSVSSNAAGTFTAIVGTSHHVTLAAAILEPGAAAQKPQSITIARGIF